MERRPFPAKALHGGYDQAARFRVMSAFRTGEVKALIATDVASRGIDVDHVTHVVNFSVPRDVSDYTHRIGRTGRAGRDGMSITLVTPRAQRDWKSILRQVNWDIEPLERPGRTDRGRGGSDRSEQPRQRGRGESSRGGRFSGRGERESGSRRGGSAGRGGGGRSSRGQRGGSESRRRPQRRTGD